MKRTFPLGALLVLCALLVGCNGHSAHPTPLPDGDLDHETESDVDSETGDQDTAELEFDDERELDLDKEDAEADGETELADQDDRDSDMEPDTDPDEQADTPDGDSDGDWEGDSDKDTEADGYDGDSEPDKELDREPDLEPEPDKDVEPDLSDDDLDEDADTGCKDDKYEPNNTIGTAYDTGVNRTLQNVVLNDVDDYTFEVGAYGTLRVTADFDKVRDELKLELFDAGGNPIASGTWLEGMPSLDLMYTRTAGGTARYVVRLSGGDKACLTYTISVYTRYPSPCSPNPCTQASAAYCDPDGITLQTPQLPGSCTVVNNSASCSYSTKPSDCRNQGVGYVCSEGACRLPQPGQGSLVITEIMTNPILDLSTNKAQWIELYNPTNTTFNLHACRLSGNGGLRIISEELLSFPHEYMLFARSATQNGGLPTPELVFDFSLSVVSDTVTLSCGATTVDAVSYSEPKGFPYVEGKSLSLTPAALSAAGNDVGTNWCPGSTLYYTGSTGASNHYGSPKQANPVCPKTISLEWCRFQGPLAQSALAESLAEFSGRVRIAGLTDASPGYDADSRVTAQFGYGPDQSYPDGNSAWVWSNASGNITFNGTAVGEPYNDEYRASIRVPAPGVYDTAYRFSIDGGHSWLYCDMNAGPNHDGSEDGYAAERAGSLISLPKDTDPCAGNPCTSPPAAACQADGTTRLVYSLPATCTNVNGSASCSYTQQTSNCADLGRICRSGSCVMPTDIPQYGDLIITEIMFSPAFSLSYPTAEWIEIYNPSTQQFKLSNCHLGHNGLETTNLPQTLTIAGKSYLLLARSTTGNGGLIPDATFDFTISNMGDSVSLTCQNTLIDSVSYSLNTWPYKEAYSIQLDPSSYDADLNNDPSAWCLSQDVYFTDPYQSPAHDNYGTPRVGNPSCPPPPMVDWCRLDRPTSVTAQANKPLNVYGRVRINGVTNLTPLDDYDSQLVGQAGYGPQSSNPAGNSSWTWFIAYGNPQYNGNDVGEPNNDEYFAQITTPPIGQYDLAFRYSYDRGHNWRYCDVNAGSGADGSENGYQLANAGKITTTQDLDPCSPNPCFQPPAPACSADARYANDYTVPGACVVGGGIANCTYTLRSRDCTQYGASSYCSSGSCVGDMYMTYFSEYFNSSTDFRALEIYNAGSETIALDTCKVRVYKAGASTYTAYPIGSGVVLGADSTYMLCTKKLADSNVNIRCSIGDPNLAFEGNDTVALVCNGQFMDVVGRIGGNPGSGGWGSGDTVTVERDLRRDCFVWIGDRNPNDAYDPTSEWIPYGTGMLGDFNHYIACK